MAVSFAARRCPRAQPLPPACPYLHRPRTAGICGPPLPHVDHRQASASRSASHDLRQRPAHCPPLPTAAPPRQLPERDVPDLLPRGAAGRRVRDHCQDVPPCVTLQARDQTKLYVTLQPYDTLQHDKVHEVAVVGRHPPHLPCFGSAAGACWPGPHAQIHRHCSRTHPRSHRGRSTRYERLGHGMVNPQRAPSARHVRLRRRRPELPT